MTKDEALKLALEALEEAWYHVGTFQPTEKAIDLYDEARTAIKEALAQPEQEPVAWISTSELLVMRGNALGGAKDWRINLGLVKQDGDVGLYTIPPQRTWVGLTDIDYAGLPLEQVGLVRWAEAKLKEKNG